LRPSEVLKNFTINLKRRPLTGSAFFCVEITTGKSTISSSGNAHESPTQETDFKLMD